MENTPKSKGQLLIERIMQELDPESDRYQVLATAKRFKSSWVELGEKLLRVSREGLFRQWGYDSFEEYCSREVRIKKPTAEKLTLAYRYMEKDEPELISRRTELKPPPDFRSVDLLRRAREEEDFNDEEYAELRRAVVEEERSHPTVLKRFKEVSAARSDEPIDPKIPLKAALAAARRLDSALHALPQPPEQHLENLSGLIANLEEELESASKEEDT